MWPIVPLILNSTQQGPEASERQQELWIVTHRRFRSANGKLRIERACPIGVVRRHATDPARVALDELQDTVGMVGVGVRQDDTVNPVVPTSVSRVDLLEGVSVRHLAAVDEDPSQLRRGQRESEPLASQRPHNEEVQYRSI
jgi:hypothetical protein